MPKVFLDTNVLVYASDGDSPGKQSRARKLIGEAGRDGTGVVSTQVLQEFYVTATRKLGIEPIMAKGIISSLRRLEVVTIQLDDINRAIDGSVLWQLSFWDALILAGAEKASCAVCYSEDLNPGQHYEGVQVLNPFG
jgi:predicted nucleic acid-binding protein